MFATNSFVEDLHVHSNVHVLHVPVVEYVLITVNTTSSSNSSSRILLSGIDQISS